MSWRSQNENYGAFNDSSYERTNVKQIPEYGAKDQVLERRRNKITTTAGNYGSFYKPDDGRYGPKKYAIDSELIPPSNPRLDGRYMVSTHGYTNPLNQAHDTVNLSRYEPPLPPIRLMNDIDGSKSPRREMAAPSRNRVNVREVANVELSILTKDLSTVKLSQQSRGMYGATSYPENLQHVYNSDIKELNIRVQNRDGSSTNILAVPKPLL